MNQYLFCYYQIQEILRNKIYYGMKESYTEYFTFPFAAQRSLLIILCSPEFSIKSIYLNEKVIIYP